MNRLDYKVESKKETKKEKNFFPKKNSFPGQA